MKKLKSIKKSVLKAHPEFRKEDMPRDPTYEVTPRNEVGTVGSTEPPPSVQPPSTSYQKIRDNEYSTDSQYRVETQDNNYENKY